MADSVLVPEAGTEVFCLLAEGEDVLVPRKMRSGDGCRRGGLEELRGIADARISVRWASSTCLPGGFRDELVGWRLDDIR